MKRILFPGLVGEMAKKGDTQEKLGKIIGINRVSIINKLSGRTEWTFNEIEAICKRYDKDFNELFKKSE